MRKCSECVGVVDDESSLAIDEAWLRSVGFVDMTLRDSTELVLRFKVLCDTQWLEVGPATYSHGLFTIHRYSDTHADADMPPDFVEVKAKTRADVLRLLSALNISTAAAAKEGA